MVVMKVFLLLRLVGEYKVDFILTDELGNESRLREYSSFKVGAIDISAKTKPGCTKSL
jgi:hypothetical protein